MTLGKLARQIVPGLAYQRGWNNVLRRHTRNLAPKQQTLAQPLSSRQKEIACMWRFAKNNGITEGFRKLNHYRLRVIALCG